MFTGPDTVRCAVLAGGKGRRMGGGVVPKPLLRVPESGPTLIERAVRSLVSIDAHPMIVGRRGWVLPVPLAALPEAGDDGRGPLCGLITAMEAVHCTCLLVAACDMPFIDQEIAAVVVEEALRTGAGVCPVLVDPEGASEVQPLLAVYRQNQLSDLRSLECEGVRSMREAVARLEMPMMVLTRNAATERCFMNVNTPADLAEARRIAAE